MPSVEALLQALDNGLVPSTIMDAMDEQAKCGVVSGEMKITCELFAPQDSNLMAVDALDNGLVLSTIIDAMDEQAKCGVVPGKMKITSELFAPQDCYLVAVEGTFTPLDGTAVHEFIKTTLNGWQ